MHGPARCLTALVLVAASACGKETSGLGRASSIDEVQVDAGPGALAPDGSVTTDAAAPGPTLDAGGGDGATPDATTDASAPPDAASPGDSDGGADDTSDEDAGWLDAGWLDAGARDGGALDAGPLDGGAPDDAGTGQDGGLGSDAGPDGPTRCPGHELVGDVEIRRAADVAALEGVTCIRGNLSVWHDRDDLMPLPFGPLLDLRIVSGDVSFADGQRWAPPRAPNLERIDGTLSLGTAQPLELPALTTVGTLMIEWSATAPSADIVLPALREVRRRVDARLLNQVHVIRLPALERVGGAFNLATSPNLSELHVPNLRVIEGDFLIKQAASLAVLSFPALERVQSFSVSETTASDALRVIDLPVLRTATRVSIASRTVERVGMRSLEQVEGLLGMVDVNALRAMELPGLARVQTLYIARAWALTDMAVPSLRELSGGLLSDCPQLSECVVPAINAQLDPSSGHIRGVGLRSDPDCDTP